MLAVLLLTLSLTQARRSPKQSARAPMQTVGAITIKEDGQDVTRYVATTWATGITVSGSSVSLSHDNQIQIMKQKGNYTADGYVEYKLAGKTVSFTTNISSISCSCNAAFYFSSMPGYSSNGKPNPGTSGNYYCDANDKSDYCWEMDVMEANKYVLQVTPHQCSGNAGGYISKCDGGGCATNSYRTDSKGMCPDSSCKINTMQPYKQSITFGNTLHVVLSQGSNTFAFDACNYNSAYVQSMNQAFEYGMVMIMSYWGDGYNEMSWLDSMTGCKGDCDVNGLVTFSDIEIA